MDVDGIATDVASIAGVAGACDVPRALARDEPVAARALSAAQRAWGKQAWVTGTAR